MTLMVGGPKHGEDLIGFDDDRHAVRIPVKRDESFPGLFGVAMYYSKKVVWFDRVMRVWVHESLTESGADYALMTIVLSPAGLKMWQEGTKRP